MRNDQSTWVDHSGVLWVVRTEQGVRLEGSKLEFYLKTQSRPPLLAPNVATRLILRINAVVSMCVYGLMLTVSFLLKWIELEVIEGVFP